MTRLVLCIVGIAAVSVAAQVTGVGGGWNQRRIVRQPWHREYAGYCRPSDIKSVFKTRSWI